jgi:hypothetical protein
MSGKTVDFKLPDQAKMDKFVDRGSVSNEVAVPVVERKAVPMRQLTVEIPESLHAELKMECVRLDVKSYEVARKALALALETLRSFDRDQAADWLEIRRR